MSLNIGDSQMKVLWSELFPDEFKHRLNNSPIVYLPLGLCEPHGQISVFGLDLIKAEYICAETARTFGGIVAPSLGYHIHETGVYAQWLDAEIGQENPHMTSIPAFVYLYFFLYQLRSFVNAGFKAIIVLSGHGGGNQIDLRRISDLFMQYVQVNIWVGIDPELVQLNYKGDHAGKYEISQLMYLRPDFIDMNKTKLEHLEGTGGKFALGNDAVEASPSLGESIIKDCVLALGEITNEFAREVASTPLLPHISIQLVETIWREFLNSPQPFVTLLPLADYHQISENSHWKKYENLDKFTPPYDFGS